MILFHNTWIRYGGKKLTGLFLTKSTTFVIGQVAQILGYIMEGIFWVLDKIGIPSVGLSIIIFTIVIYLLMTPLTLKQQKFSKLSAKMNPELQVIQSKYKGKKDNDSMAAMQQETSAVYAKYGVSPSGSCIQLVIQMPILFALYKVIYAMPAYVGKIKEAYFPLVNNLLAEKGSSDLLQTFTNATMYKKQFSNDLFNTSTTFAQNTVIDVLNKASSTDWNTLSTTFSNLAGDVSNTLAKIDRYNSFLGINIGDSPAYMVKQALASHSYLLIVGALILPVLSVVTQWLNIKLMPQAPVNNNTDDKANSMAASMKTMNKIMPLMSAYFCYILPAGMGLYWVAGALVRSVQQVIVNKHLDKIDIDALTKKNMEKHKKKIEKTGITSQTVNNYARMNTKNVDSIPSKNVISQEDKEAAVKKAAENNKNAKPGSLASKAGMVKQFNENNNK